MKKDPRKKEQLTDWLLRTCAPAWLRAVGEDRTAEILSGLPKLEPEIVEKATNELRAATRRLGVSNDSAFQQQARNACGAEPAYGWLCEAAAPRKPEKVIRAAYEAIVAASCKADAAAIGVLVAGLAGTARVFRIYLSGPITNQSDHGMSWRHKTVTNYLRVAEFGVPYLPGVADRDIVRRDLRDIDRSNAVLWYRKAGCSSGSAMEAWYAKSIHVPVVTVAERLSSPWERWVTTKCVPTLGEAMIFLTKRTEWL